MSSDEKDAACDCDYWHSKHRWHCATNYPTPAPDLAARIATQGAAHVTRGAWLGQGE